jgi:signal peptide peptidase SppA
LSTAAPSEMRRYDRAGILALEPQAFFGSYAERPRRVNIRMGDVEVVDIEGPLDARAGGWCDSYEDVELRVAAACDGPARVIVLRIDSPGGDAAGCFETTRKLRERAAAVKKRLVAYVGRKACSGGYALATAADEIYLGAAALVGSIGVIETRVDLSEANAQRGVRFAVIASGERKADGHPDVPITADELRERRVIIDSIASVFFDVVAEMRGTTRPELATPEKVKALQAAVFTGDAAVKVGLVDQLGTFEQMITSLAGEKETKRTPLMATKLLSDTKASLEEIAKGDGEDAKKAKKALAALAADDEEEKPKEEKPAAEAEEEEEEKPKEEKPAASVSTTTAASLAAQVSEQGKQLAELRRERDAESRATFLATRPDLDPALVKVLSSKPLDEVKAIVAAIPKPPTPKPAAASTVPVTRGAAQGPSEPSAHSAELDRRMGLTSDMMGVRRDGNSMIFGAMPKPAAAGNEGGAK